MLGFAAGLFLLPCQGCRIRKQVMHLRKQIVRVLNRDQAVPQIRAHAGEIVHMGAMKHGAALTGRLKHILPPVGNQAAPHKNNGGETIKQIHLPHGIHQINIFCGILTG